MPTPPNIRLVTRPRTPSSCSSTNVRYELETAMRPLGREHANASKIAPQALEVLDIARVDNIAAQGGGRHDDGIHDRRARDRGQSFVDDGKGDRGGSDPEREDQQRQR